MNTYRVIKTRIYTEVYEVQASSQEEAEGLVREENRNITFIKGKLGNNCRIKARRIKE